MRFSTNWNHDGLKPPTPLTWRTSTRWYSLCCGPTPHDNVIGYPSSQVTSGVPVANHNIGRVRGASGSSSLVLLRIFTMERRPRTSDSSNKVLSYILRTIREVGLSCYSTDLHIVLFARGGDVIPDSRRNGYSFTMVRLGPRGSIQPRGRFFYVAGRRTLKQALPRQSGFCSVCLSVLERRICQPRRRPSQPPRAPTPG